MTNKIQTSRRKFIAGTSSLLALSSISGYLQAGQLETLKSQFVQLSDQQGIVVYKEGDAHSTEFASVFSDAGMSVVALGIDPVRQWRDGLSEALSNKQQPIMGLTNWSDYLMMRGLAAELRRYPVLETQHKVNQLNNSDWASAHARKLLAFSSDQSLQDIQQAFEESNTAQQLTGKSLFSWVII